jgi:hypothetical protein
LEFVTKLAILERFIIPSAIISILLVPFGILLFRQVIEKLVKKTFLRAHLINLSLGVFFIIPVASFVVNFEKTNLKDIWVGDYLAQDILATAPKDAILLLNSDHYIFNTIYHQFVYNTRPDLKIPGAHEGFGKLIENSPVLGSINISDYNKKRANLIDENILLISLLDTVRVKDVYVDVGIGLELTKNQKLIPVPYGILNKLEYSDRFNVPKDEYLKQIDHIWSLYHENHFADKNEVISENIILSDIRGQYVLALLRTANFINKHYNDPETARLFQLKALQTDPLYLIRDDNLSL